MENRLNRLQLSQVLMDQNITKVYVYTNNLGLILIDKQAFIERLVDHEQTDNITFDYGLYNGGTEIVIESLLKFN